jgi:DNA-binding transcriptional MerR regulator
VHDDAHLRIGELSRRTGVAPELLRAWERRYALLEPRRTQGGFRLYSTGDLRRVQRMVEHLAQGISAAQAATLAREAQEPTAAEPLPEGVGADLVGALDRLDDGAAQAAFDELLARYSLDAVLRDAILPYLHTLGDRWEHGRATVAQEHFASALLRGRLLSLARGWDRGTGPRAVLACAPGELHDLSLLVFGLALRERGWRITYLGASTPLESVAETADAVMPELVVLVAIVSDALAEQQAAIAELTRQHPVALAGAAASAALAEAVGATFLGGDPVAEAEEVAAALSAGR